MRVGAEADQRAERREDAAAATTISATSQLGTPSSTIMTRFSVPFSSTSAMPTETWNSDRRSRRRKRQLGRRRVGERQEARAEQRSSRGRVSG